MYFYCSIIVMSLFYIFSSKAITQKCKVGFEEMKKAEQQLECIHQWNFPEGLPADLREKK